MPFADYVGLIIGIGLALLLAGGIILLLLGLGPAGSETPHPPQPPRDLDDEIRYESGYLL